MIQVVGDIWQFLKHGWYVGITTNGTVLQPSMNNIMGAGIARQAKDKFKGLETTFGTTFYESGHRVHLFHDVGLFSFPVKHTIDVDASMDLVEKSCKQLRDLYTLVAAGPSRVRQYALVRPGCGVGGLTWDEVEPLMERYFKDLPLIIVDLKR